MIHLAGAARRPEGDVILADIAREDASVVLADLKELGSRATARSRSRRSTRQISDPADGPIERAPGRAGRRRGVGGGRAAHERERRALRRLPRLHGPRRADRDGRASTQDSAILIVGAMVVGPEFGPIAGFCVAAVQRRPQLALRSALALAVGFPLAITARLARDPGLPGDRRHPGRLLGRRHGLADLISNPDFFAFFVAVCAGVAGHAQRCRRRSPAR